MQKPENRAIIVLAHPNLKESVANKALKETIEKIDNVDYINLYDEIEEFKIEEHRQLISNAHAIIFQFPLYWAMAPHLLKKWIDEVFSVFAQDSLLKGKTLTIVVTASSAAIDFRSAGLNQFSIDELLRPYQICTIHAGMKWTSPLLIPGIGSEKQLKNIEAGKKAFQKYIAELTA